jgi:glycerol uptake facilitator-like aquaporin
MASYRRLVAEALGSALLVATVVGSGVMAASLTEDGALALLGNTLPTGAILVVLISVLGPVSGAHLNPAVTVALWLRREVAAPVAMSYILAQVIGAVCGTLLGHAMFELPLVQFGGHARTGTGQWLAEGVATFGLVVTVIGGTKVRPASVPWLVGLYITAAYWFTSSTSFANPAVTIARALTDSFSGIRPIDAPLFIVSQIAGAALAVVLATWLWQAEDGVTNPPPSS